MRRRRTTAVVATTNRTATAAEAAASGEMTMALMASAATTATPLTIHHHQREAPASTSVIASSSFSSDASPPPWPSLQADWPTVLFNCVICGCWGAEVRSVPPKAAETAAQDALKRWRRAVTGSRNRSSSAPSSLRHYMYDPPANWVEWAARPQRALFVSTGKSPAPEAAAAAAAKATRWWRRCAGGRPPQPRPDTRERPQRRQLAQPAPWGTASSARCSAPRSAASASTAAPRSTGAAPRTGRVACRSATFDL